jgi:hypothetical protein
MMSTPVRLTLMLGMLGALPATAVADAHDLTPQQCISAHSRGQDAHSAGQLSLARELFLSCAQKSCPTLVQEDCAQFANDLNREQPTLAFVARDAAGTDLPDTTVYVDDALVVTRLDDGSSHDVDPGKHVVRFVHAGRDRIVTVVVNSGEKGRIVTASFAAVTPGAAPLVAPPRPDEVAVHRHHPPGAKLTMVAGGLVFVGGVALGIYGLTQLPANCALSSHQCSAPPGDPVFGDAAHAVSLSNYGFGIGAIGLAAAVGGAIWYVRGAHTEGARPGVAIRPWFAPRGGGLTLSGSL